MTSFQSDCAASPTFVAQMFCVAALATAGFMLVTAPQLGPMAPLVIALGLYLGFFAVVIELGLGARALYSTCMRSIDRRGAPSKTRTAS